ncbi:ABC transporter permease, partial [Streptomyces boncukensis]
VGGTLGVDPVLVAAPALALLAGTVLVLRLLPLAARLGERRATRGRGLATALAGWQLSRRPLRGAGPALLLVLAVATGVFAVGQGASWDRSQGDQADFRTGADVAVGGSTAGALGQGGLYDGVDGVTAVAPVARSEFTVEGDRSARVLATDTRTAGNGLLRMRGDLADEPLPRLLRPLSGARRDGRRQGASGPRRTGIPLPEGTRELRLALAMDVLGKAGGKGGNTATTDTLTLTLEDRYGIPYAFILGEVPADGRTHVLTARPAASGGVPAGPLRITRLSLSYAAPQRATERKLTVSSLRAVVRGGGTRTVHAPRAGRWPVRMRADDVDGTLGKGPYDRPTDRPAAVRPKGAPLTFRYRTGSAPAPHGYQDQAVPVTFEMTPEGPGPDAPLPAVATDAYLRASGNKVGDQAKVQFSGTELTVRIAGSVHALPTVSTGRSGAQESAGPAGDGQDGGAGGGRNSGQAAGRDEGQRWSGALLFDLAALDRALADADGDPLEPEGWWLSTRPGSTARVARELRENPAVEQVQVRDEVAERLRGDPLGAGPRTALTAIALAAAVLAAAGFAVSAAGAARERAGEFAVLRALGAPRRRLAQALAAEQGLVVLLSLAVGLVLGAVLTRLVVPLIVLTQDAARPVPDLLVRLPLGQLSLLLAAVLAAPLAVVAVTALRRTDPVPALRAERGE